MMEQNNHYDVCDKSGTPVVAFDLLKDAELWVAEQSSPNDYEIIPVVIHECSTPLNLFLGHGMLTRNKK